MLGRLRKKLSSNMLNRIYLTYIQPSIDYAISLWGHCGENLKKFITRIQHRAARIVTGEFDFINIRGHELMLRLRWQSVDQRRDYFTTNLMFKCLTDTAPVHLKNEISSVSETHSINTRASQNLNVSSPRPNIEFFKKSFAYHGPHVWNSLPDEVKSAENLNEMKRLYKRVML